MSKRRVIWGDSQFWGAYIVWKVIPYNSFYTTSDVLGEIHACESYMWVSLNMCKDYLGVVWKL